MSNIKLNISDVTNKAWELAKKHGLIVAVVILAVGLISQSFGLVGFPWSAYMEAIAENNAEALEAMTDGMGALSALSILGGLVSIAHLLASFPSPPCFRPVSRWRRQKERAGNPTLSLSHFKGPQSRSLPFGCRSLIRACECILWH